MYVNMHSSSHRLILAHVQIYAYCSSSYYSRYIKPYLYRCYLYTVVAVKRVINALPVEPNRAKPRMLGRIFPARDRAQIKIAPLGRALRARAAHLLAQSGYFYSAWFSRSKEFCPYFLETRAL
jgi:hypothetical protein